MEDPASEKAESPLVVTAEVIECFGNWGDHKYSALQLNVEGFSSPYVLTLALPRLSFQELAKQVDPLRLYKTLADAINRAEDQHPVETPA